MVNFLFDTHFHLDLIKNQERTKELIESKQIYTIAVTNVPDLYRREKEGDNKYIRHALGFHPELVEKYTNQRNLMWKLLPAARYIGEVGLDYSNGESREQEKFFSELIDRIRQDKKIVTIHSRKAEKEVIDILGNDFAFVPILHWYSGGKKELIRAIAAGCYISINHKMVNTKKFKSLSLEIPIERLLLETDLPFSETGMVHDESLIYTIRVLGEVYGTGYLRMHFQLCNNFRKILE